MLTIRCLAHDAMLTLALRMHRRGGRCTTPGLCLEMQSPTTPPEMYIANVGLAPGGCQIDLRITNQSKFRAWSSNMNGVKREVAGSTYGYFGVINLLGPRDPRQRPYDMYWNEYITGVQLNYCMLCSTTGAPVTIGRFFMTF